MAFVVDGIKDKKDYIPVRVLHINWTEYWMQLIQILPLIIINELALSCRHSLANYLHKYIKDTPGTTQWQIFWAVLKITLERSTDKICQYNYILNLPKHFKFFSGQFEYFFLSHGYEGIFVSAPWIDNIIQISRICITDFVTQKSRDGFKQIKRLSIWTNSRFTGWGSYFCYYLARDQWL